MMDPWQAWAWPWLTTMDIYRRALEPGRDEAAAPKEPEWTTPNRVTLDLPSLLLRDFSSGESRARPVLVVSPFSLHDAALADLAPGHSPIESLLANGCHDLFLAQWKSATAQTRLNTIDSQFATLNVVVDEIGPPVDLIGLCQGGWLSLAYAARFPNKVRRLALVGAPIDMAAAPSAFSGSINPATAALIEELIRRGGGLALGRDLAELWPRPLDKLARTLAALELEPPTTEAGRRALENFSRWDARLLDLPGPYQRDAFHWLYRENRLATGRFWALGAPNRSEPHRTSAVSARRRARRHRAAGAGFRGGRARRRAKKRHRDRARALRASGAVHGPAHGGDAVAAHREMAIGLDALRSSP